MKFREVKVGERIIDDGDIVLKVSENTVRRRTSFGGQNYMIPWEREVRPYHKEPQSDSTGEDAPHNTAQPDMPSAEEIWNAFKDKRVAERGIVPSPSTMNATIFAVDYIARHIRRA